MFEKIRKFYRLRLYSKEQVAQYVVKGVITAAQYEQITGEPYEG